MVALTMGGGFFHPHIWPQSVGMFGVADQTELEAARKRYYRNIKKEMTHAH